MGQKMYTMGKDMSSPMIGSNMGKMMRQNMYQIVPSWDEPMEDIAGNVGNNMDNTMMGAPMVLNMGANNKITGFNIGHGQHPTLFGFPMFGSPMMGQKSYTNMMGRDMSSSMMDRSMMGSQDMYTNANLMGHDMNRMAPVNMMSQKMQIETMPSQS